jgi:hypothetical protein
MSQKVRNRQENWSEDEKNALLDMIEENVVAIETKAADSSNLVAKKKAWKNVLELFQSKYGHGRDTIHLKDQWKRLKIQAKKTHAAYKVGTSMTGGGKRTPPIPKLLERVMQMCPLDFIPRHNPLDSDRHEGDNITV